MRGDRARGIRRGDRDRVRGIVAGVRFALAAATLAALVAVATLLPAPEAAAAQPSVGDAPSWVSLRTAWRRAAAARHDSRWHESLETMVAAERRAASAESLYRASLLAWEPGPSALRVAPAVLREAALDLVAWGAPDKATALLEGPLRDDELLLPLRAAALGRTGDAAAGLALLGWPADRRLARGDRWKPGMTSAVRGETRDVGHLLTAAALCDSVRDARGARAAWRAILSAAAAPSAGPAARELARLRLAKRCLAEGTPRLAAALLENPPSGAHA
ncbi:MAG TPA: hypothetical protein VFT32_05265, partial [Candidatus Eisenbacteria bacterium]|nr:hypothetical protein [Candidatus Eisenbacteria bacterium]